MTQSNVGMGAGSGAGSSTTQTGTPDVTYDLISVIYHALQGAETYGKYIQDAQQGGNQEVAQFLREVQQENERRATRGRELLARCLQQGQGNQRMSQ
ncbi:MAG: hypothetical protein M3Z31_06790 [Pseudomonadota bacterium]|nr:hypothetical protein [Pseudomonadota bacterium]